MYATLDEYQKYISDFKAQISELSLNKTQISDNPQIDDLKIQKNLKRRDSFDQQFKKEAIEMCFYLMETTHISRHKAAS